MGDFIIPAIPPVLLLVLNFFSPYLVSIFTAVEWSPNAKKAVAIVVSFVVSAAVIALALWVGWVPLDSSPIGIVTLVAIGLLLQQSAYRNFIKESADVVQETVGVGKHAG